ncbi:peptidoglycan-associated lipoprotein Pal [Ferrimonas marina]|uniref:Peptidoglycan-associated lipoprotein n=1 Tax=Ferrimonas marina TaxID=299255 RepID=A0A1M5QSD3_9GAMM|nr:peptidoglycan-associated lipoprotein Pal [Ferrimonas marina]SHH17065.1 peptidoglycan-associated lipoprotein [Ferrimonas marina]
MKLKQLAKGLMFAIPALALTACSSTSSVDADAEALNNQTAQEQQGGPQVGGLEQVQSPEEMQRQKYAELRKEHILYFDFDRSDIRPEFGEMLEAHAAFLVENPRTQVVIEGHADERGTPEYNIALSERRGKAVQRYLQSLGVLSSQMEVVPYGEEKLLDTAANEAAHAKNRRAVLVY